MPSLQPRRAGVLVPVFAIRTPDDLGIGDIGGVRQLIDWAADTGLGLVQFLPINATGSDSSPYNAISSVALDYLTLDLTPQAVPELDEKFYATVTGILRADLLRQGAVNYPKVRRLKNTLLRRAFSQIETQPRRMAEFEGFCVKEAAWLDDFCLFKVLMEGGVAAGIRRVEAVTGEGALAHVQRIDRSLADLAGVLRTSPAELQGRVGQVLDQVRTLEKELGRLKSKMAASQGDDLFTRALDVKGVKLLAAALETGDAKALRETMDKLKDKLKSAVIVLGGAADGKVALIAGVTPDLVGKVKAGELVNFVAQQVGGKGGGRADMAQAGGTEPAKLPQALAAVEAWVSERL
jgi:hypothetical protein